MSKRLNYLQHESWKSFARMKYDSATIAFFFFIIRKKCREIANEKSCHGRICPTSSSMKFHSKLLANRATDWTSH